MDSIPHHERQSLRQRVDLVVAAGYRWVSSGASTMSNNSVREAGRAVASFSICMALGLAAWQIYYFWFAGRGVMGPLEGSVGLFTPDRVGLNVAWLCVIYLTLQLLSIPFAVSSPGGRFSSVLDGMASIVPLFVVVIYLLGGLGATFDRTKFEVALILVVVNLVDLFGGYVFTISLSRRSVDLNN